MQPLGEEVLIDCRGLVIGWNGRALLPSFDLTLRRGRFVAVIGRNGSGKTTWFKTLLGETAPISGSIERSRTLKHIAYIPQTNAFDSLLPLSAWDVVMHGRLHCNNFLRPFSSRADRRACLRAMESAGAEGLSAEMFRDLSKGQRQRVMVARMLATEAELALLDEPTAAMDVVAERDTMQRLTDLCRQHGIAVVCISHSLNVAEKYADDILLFDHARGEVLFDERELMLAHGAYQRLVQGDRGDA